MTIELRKVIPARPAWFEDKYKDLPLIRPPLVMSDDDGEFRDLLHTYQAALQALEQPLTNWYQAMRLNDNDDDMHTWHNWFPLPPWPVDDTPALLEAWRREREQQD